MGEIVQEMYFVLLLQDYLSELQKERGDKQGGNPLYICAYLNL